MFLLFKGHIITSFGYKKQKQSKVKRISLTAISKFFMGVFPRYFKLKPIFLVS